MNEASIRFDDWCDGHWKRIEIYMGSAARPTRPVLTVEVDSTLQDRRISLPHMGQGLCLLQRLINSAANQMDAHDSFLGDLSRKSRLHWVHLSIGEVHSGSAIYKLFFDALQDPFIQAQLGVAETTVTTVLTTLLTNTLIEKVKRLRNGENPFKPNDATRKQLEELAAVAKRGKLVFTIRLGTEVSIIDAKTQEQLDKLKMRYRGKPDDFTGTVVGSSMRRRFIEVNVVQFAADVPCVYKKRLEKLVEPISRLSTAVGLRGVPVWEGQDGPYGAPTSIDVLDVMDLQAPSVVTGTPVASPLFGT